MAPPILAWSNHSSSCGQTFLKRITLKLKTNQLNQNETGQKLVTLRPSSRKTFLKNSLSSRMSERAPFRIDPYIQQSPINRVPPFFACPQGNIACHRIFIRPASNCQLTRRTIGDSWYARVARPSLKLPLSFQRRAERSVT